MKKCSDCGVLAITTLAKTGYRNRKIYCPKCGKSTLFVDGLKYAKACWDRMNRNEPTELSKECEG